MLQINVDPSVLTSSLHLRFQPAFSVLLTPAVVAHQKYRHGCTAWLWRYHCPCSLDCECHHYLAAHGDVRGSASPSGRSFLPSSAFWGQCWALHCAIWTYQHAGAAARHVPVRTVSGQFCTDEATTRIRPSKTPNSLHGAGRKRGSSLKWQQAISEAEICLGSLVSTCWHAAPSFKGKIRPNKQVLLPKRLVSHAQMPEKSPSRTSIHYF